MCHVPVVDRDFLGQGKAVTAGNPQVRVPPEIWTLSLWDLYDARGPRMRRDAGEEGAPLGDL